MKDLSTPIADDDASVLTRNHRGACRFHVLVQWRVPPQFEGVIQDPLPAVERNAAEIRAIACKALSVLGPAANIPTPSQYLQVMSALSDLRPAWCDHMRLFSHAYPLISSGNVNIATAVMRQFEEDLASMASSLEILDSAGWARTPDIGVNSMRGRVTTTLRTILCCMEKEQMVLIPLLRRSVALKAEPIPLAKQDGGGPGARSAISSVPWASLSEYAFV